MKKTIILVALLVLAGIAHAQDASLAVGMKVNKANGKPVVQLKFIFPEKVLSPYEVNVFRKLSPAGNWEKISAAPVVKALAGKPGSAQEESFNLYQSFITRTPSADTVEENNALAMAGLFIVTDNLFATYAGCYYEDVTAEAGKTYQYKITNAALQDKELAVSAAFIVTEHYLPLVKGLAVLQKRNSILLNWEKNRQFYAYKIYRSTKAGEKGSSLSAEPIMLSRSSGSGLKNTIDDYKYTDSNIVAGTTVYYTVMGIDVLGNESPASEPVSIGMKDMTAPETVRGLKAAKEKNTVVLNWQGSIDKDAAGYNIYRNNAHDTAYRKITNAILPLTTTTFTDQSMKEGDVYGYYIESVDASGNTSRSHPAKVFMPDQSPPSRPAGLKAMTKPGVIELSWDNNKEADLLGYYIYRSSNRNKEYFNLLNKEAYKSNKFVDSMFGVAKNEFIYYVQAADKSYNMSAPSDTVITLLPDTTAPHAPFIHIINYTANVVSFKWQKPDADIKGYDVYRSTDSVNGTYTKRNSSLITETSFTDNDIKESQEYYYSVKAIDDAGNTSPGSNKRGIYTDADTTRFSAAKDIKSSYNVRDSSVQISWKQDAKNLRGSIVFRRETEEDHFIAVSEMIPGTDFTDKEINPDTAYQYQVRSYFSNTDHYINSAIVSVDITR